MPSSHPFKSLETSFPRFEFEGLRFVTVKSPALAGRADLCCWRPPRTPGPTTPLPLVILLHGIYGSHWAWALNGGAHRTTARLIANGEIPPMALAMPSDGLWGDGSGYLPHHGRDFEAWILEDVPRAANAALTGLTPDSPLFITGLSMGGFGALRLGARHSGRIRAFSGMSSVTELSQLNPMVDEPVESFGADPDSSSLFLTLLKHRDRLVPFRFDCGTEDPLYPANATLHERLVQQAIPHVFESHPGNHTWEYWEKHLADTLCFFAQVLKTIPPERPAAPGAG